MGFKKPFLISHDGTHIYPSVAPGTGGVRDTKAREAHQHVAASGKTITYYVGPHAFKEVEFPWQDETLKAEWITFWSKIREGKPFWYCDLDGIPICGDGTTCTAFLLGPSIVGDTGTTASSGDTVTATLMVCDQDEINFDDEDVWGYYRTGLRMREAV